MNEKETLVIEEIAENTETTAEEIKVAEEVTPKTYTEEEFNAKLDEVLGKKLARREAKIRKEYDRKYGELESVLKAGSGAENVEDMTTMFRKHYEDRGIKMPSKPTYSDKDTEILARAEANEIINSGFDEVVEEVDRLAKIGVSNMSAREKVLFKTLAEHRQATERQNELSAIGVGEDVYNSQEFKEFASKFNSQTPIKDVYDIYKSTKPKKQIQTMGSMKSTAAEKVKDFYTADEISKLTEADLKDEKVWNAVRRSMTGI